MTEKPCCKQQYKGALFFSWIHSALAHTQQQEMARSTFYSTHMMRAKPGRTVLHRESEKGKRTTPPLLGGKAVLPEE